MRLRLKREREPVGRRRGKFGQHQYVFAPAEEVRSPASCHTRRVSGLLCCTARDRGGTHATPITGRAAGGGGYSRAARCGRSFRAASFRCPDMTKDPDQIEAEGERAARIATRVGRPSHTLGAAGAPGGGTNDTTDCSRFMLLVPGPDGPGREPVPAGRTASSSTSCVSSPVRGRGSPARAPRLRSWSDDRCIAVPLNILNNQPGPGHGRRRHRR